MVLITKRTVGAVLLTVATSASDAQAQTAPPSRPFIIVANQRTGAATFLEISTGRVTHVKLDGKPHEVAVSPNGRTAVLTIPSETFGASRRILVFDLGSAKVVRTIELRGYREPHGVAFLSDSVALVGTLGGTSAAYVDVKNGRVLKSVDGLPTNPYIIKTTATGRAFVSSPHSGKVSEIDVATAKILRTIDDIPDDPAGIEVSPDGTELYAAIWRDKVGGGIAVYDLSRGVMAARLPARQPRRMTLTADGKLLLVSDRDQLHLVDRLTRKIQSIPLGRDAGGSGVACAPDSTRCYVALSQAGEIVEIDVPGVRITRRFSADRGADGMAYVPR